MVDTEMQELVKPEGMPPLQWEWWKEWWAQDYSWNSERFKPYREVIFNSYNASGSLVPLETTLKSQGQLIESPDGLLFHICWLPPYWRDGIESEFYLDPRSVRNHATKAFVTYFREYSGTYAGLTSTFALMQTNISHGIPLSRAEKSFLGGPFLRIKVGGNHVVQLHNCLFSFDKQEDNNSIAVDWNVMLYRSTFSTKSKTSSALDFSRINFLSGLNLSDCNIEEHTWFKNCTFASTFFLGESPSSKFDRIFDGSLAFVECIFEKPVNANQGKKYSAISFHKCTFNDKFGANGLRVYRNFSDTLSFSESIFNKKVFISSYNLIEVAPAFAGTTLNEGIDFGPFEAVLDQKFFDKLRKDVLSFMGLKSVRDAKYNSKLAELKSQEDIELRRMISGVRVIRLASQSSGDKLSESQLHALELAAYQRLSTTQAASKFVAMLYGLSSDYGCSLLKPFVWLLVLMFVSSIGYSALNESAQLTPFSGQLNWPEVLQGLVYSVSRVIPIGPWQDLVFADSILSTGKGASSNPSSPEKIAVVFLATAQSFFSAILLFLFGLAARRKFQVG